MPFLAAPGDRPQRGPEADHERDPRSFAKACSRVVERGDGNLVPRHCPVGRSNTLFKTEFPLAKVAEAFAVGFLAEPPSVLHDGGLASGEELAPESGDTDAPRYGVWVSRNCP